MRKLSFLCFCILFFYSCQPPSNQEEKFQHIHELMEDLLKERYEISQTNFQYMKTGIKKSGNTREGLKEKEMIRLLFKKTEEELDKIEILKSLLSESNNIKGKEIVRKIMIEEQKGIKLLKDLKDYVDWLNKEYKDLPGFQGLPPLIDENQGNNSVSFIETQFGHADIYESQTYLTCLQLKIMSYPNEILTKFGSYGFTMPFSVILPIVVPVQNIVWLGDTYQADLYLGDSNPNFSRIHANEYTISLNGNPFKQNYRGSTSVNFPPAPIGKQEWKGVFKIRYDGKDRNLMFRKNYLILSKNQMDSTLRDFIQKTNK